MSYSKVPRKRNKAVQHATALSTNTIVKSEVPASSWNSSFRILNPGVDRPPLLSEYLPEHPRMVLQEVFSKPGRSDKLKEHLLKWIGEASFDGGTGDEVSADQMALKRFYYELILLLDALFCINDPSQAHIQNNKGNSLLVVRNFCERYTEVYIQRELWCLVHAASDYALNNPDEFLPADALEWYEDVSALVRSAYLLGE
jgi:hypothetical protein